MPQSKPNSKQTLAQLKAENARLKKQLERTQTKPNKKGSWNTWRLILIGFLSATAVVLLVIGNIVFWTGRTLVNTDRYIAAVGPLVQQPSIQTAIAQKTTDALFAKVDVEQLTQDALPPKAEFLAPTISSKIQQTTQDKAQELVASPSFYNFWIQVNTKAHDRLINYITNYQGDGTINLQDVYNRVSANLQNTKLSFLTGKQLPSDIGTITVVNAPNLPKAHWFVTSLGWLRWLTISVFLLATAAAVWLAKNRRKAVVRLALTYAAALSLLLIAVRITKTIAVGKVASAYQAAAGQAWNTILHSFVLQLGALMMAGILVALIAWVTGSGKRASKVRAVGQDVLAGRLHRVLFKKENRFTKIAAEYRRSTEWSLVVLAGIALLFIPLKVVNVLIVLACLLVLVFVVETLSAKKFQ